jgi:hypothetical protein
MTLADLASLGSFVSGLAVLVSLVFLYHQLRQIGVQIKQAERNQQAAIRQGRVARITETAMASLQDAGVAATVNKAMVGEELSRVEIFQFTSLVLARLYNAEDAFYQHKGGMLTADDYDSFVRVTRTTYALPGMRVIYRQHRHTFGTEFVAFMDAILTDVPVTPRRDVEAAWKAAVAAETAGAGG